MPPCPDGSERRDLARSPMGSPPNALVPPQRANGLGKSLSDRGHGWGGSPVTADPRLELPYALSLCRRIDDELSIAGAVSVPRTPPSNAAAPQEGAGGGTKACRK